MIPNPGTVSNWRNHRDFQLSVENIIDPRKSNNPSPIIIDQKFCVRNVENRIIARVTNGNETHGNSEAIEKIPGKIPTKSTITATKAMTSNTTGYVTAPINLLLNV